MELKKTSETINRSFNPDGQAEERVDNAQYLICDNDGNAVGTASVSLGTCHVNIDLNGYTAVEEGIARLKDLFGLTD